MMNRLSSPQLWPAILWAILIAASLVVRPLLPVDETRYASVAWEMWLRNDFLVPYLNGEAYSHKPPLLFWLIQFCWRLFGVNDWSLRIIAPLFALATLYLSRAAARLLWPERSRIADLTPLLLLGFSIWIIYSTLTMFDIMLTFFALAGIYSLLSLVGNGLSFQRWGLLGIAIGGGILSKGPVILLHILPVAILAPWWLDLQQTRFRWLHWYGGLILAILIGAAIALCWAIPAGIEGGEAYRNAIFFGQTSGRLVDSFAHKLSWWWYLQKLPILLLPWLLIKPFWTGLPQLTRPDYGIRFCLAWILPVFIAFSLISGKRIHYLLPLMPALALLLAEILDQAAVSSWRRAHVAIMAIIGFLGLALLLLPKLNNYYHWREALSSVSPVWGILLCLCASVFAALPAKNAQESLLLICSASIATIVILAGGFFDVMRGHYDTKPVGIKIAELMSEKRAIALFGNKYHGQFHFTGRLSQPITVIKDINDLYTFAVNHQTCYILLIYSDSSALPKSILKYHYPLKGDNIGILSCKTLVDHHELESILKP